jgi:hypothetical protein
MTTPVQLDSELPIDAVEIEDEWPQRVLTPEFEPGELSGPESIPEKALGRGQVPPQAASVIPEGRRQS